MKELANFMKDMPSMLKSMKDLTRNIFIPICITNSPAAPKEKVQMVFKTPEKIRNFTLNGWYTDNINDLCKKFVV